MHFSRGLLWRAASPLSRLRPSEEMRLLPGTEISFRECATSYTTEGEKAKRVQPNNARREDRQSFCGSALDSRTAVQHQCSVFLVRFFPDKSRHVQIFRPPT